MALTDLSNDELTQIIHDNQVVDDKLTAARQQQLAELEARYLSDKAKIIADFDARLIRPRQLRNEAEHILDERQTMEPSPAPKVYRFPLHFQILSNKFGPDWKHVEHLYFSHHKVDDIHTLNLTQSMMNGDGMSARWVYDYLTKRVERMDKEESNSHIKYQPNRFAQQLDKLFKQIKEGDILILNSNWYLFVFNDNNGLSLARMAIYGQYINFPPQALPFLVRLGYEDTDQIEPMYTQYQAFNCYGYSQLWFMGVQVNIPPVSKDPYQKRPDFLYFSIHGKPNHCMNSSESPFRIANFRP